MLKALLFVGLLILSAWPETVVAQERYLASYNVIATRRSFLEKNRGVVKRFLQAYSEGLYQFITNREKALAITNQRLKQKKYRAGRGGLSVLRTDLFFPSTRIPRRFARGLGSAAQRTSGTKVEMNADKYIDEKLLDELEREGLFQKISGKG